MKKHIILVIILLVSMTTNAQKRMSKNKKALVNSIEKHKKNLIEISDNIWEAAEPALLEFKSSNYLSDYAEENGFIVKKGVAGIPTAFTATYGTGKPVIGILGEYDANAGISQKRQPTRESRVPGGAGHGCGHNLFGTASLGAAVAANVAIRAVVVANSASELPLMLFTFLMIVFSICFIYSSFRGLVGNNYLVNYAYQAIPVPK
mgnify:CR=1 FL=1